MEWISVRNKLPSKEHHMVLVLDCECPYKSIVLAKWMDDFWWVDSRCTDMWEIKPTHWMPLPKPPKD